MDNSEMSIHEKENIKLQYAILYHKWGIDNLDHLNTNEAARYFEKSLLYQPNNNEVFEKLLLIWEKDNSMIDKVINIYKLQYDRNTDNIELAIKLSDLYYKVRDYEGSLPYLLKIHKKSKDSNYVVAERLCNTLINLFIKSYESKNYKLSQEYYLKFIDLFPSDYRRNYYFSEYEKFMNPTSNTLSMSTTSPNIQINPTPLSKFDLFESFRIPITDYIESKYGRDNDIDITTARRDLSFRSVNDKENYYVFRIEESITFSNSSLGHEKWIWLITVNKKDKNNISGDWIEWYFPGGSCKNEDYNPKSNIFF